MNASRALKPRRASWPRAIATTLLTGLLLTGMSGAAMAYHEDESDFNFPLSTSLMIIGLPSTTTAVIVCAPIPNACQITSFSLQITVDISSAEVDTMRRFMQANARTLQMDVALGAGDSVTDLAHMLHVPEAAQPRFAEALRRNRAKILPLLHSHKISSEDARTMILLMGHVRHEALSVKG